MKKEALQALLHYKKAAFAMTFLLPIMILFIALNFAGWKLLSEVIWEGGLIAIGLYYTVAFFVKYEHDESVFHGDNLAYLPFAAYGLALLSGGIITIIAFHFRAG